MATFLRLVRETLLSMGFDTDRARLITSLVSGGVAAAAAALLAGAWLPGSVLGLLGMALLYGSTFVAETQSAAATTGVYGSFSPTGWIKKIEQRIADKTVFVEENRHRRAQLIGNPRLRPPRLVHCGVSRPEKPISTQIADE